MNIAGGRSERAPFKDRRDNGIAQRWSGWPVAIFGAAASQVPDGLLFGKAMAFMAAVLAAIHPFSDARSYRWAAKRNGFGRGRLRRRSSLSVFALQRNSEIMPARRPKTFS